MALPRCSTYSFGGKGGDSTALSSLMSGAKVSRTRIQEKKEADLSQKRYVEQHHLTQLFGNMADFLRAEMPQTEADAEIVLKRFLGLVKRRRDQTEQTLRFRTSFEFRAGSSLVALQSSKSEWKLTVRHSSTSGSLNDELTINSELKEIVEKEFSSLLHFLDASPTNDAYCIIGDNDAPIYLSESTGRQALQQILKVVREVRMQVRQVASFHPVF